MWEVIGLTFLWIWMIWGKAKGFISASHLIPSGRLPGLNFDSNDCLLVAFPRARWMKMSRKYWSKSLPCVKTSPRRSKMDSLAGHCPLVVHLCVRSGVVGNHCHCPHSCSAPQPRRAFSLSKGSFLKTFWGPGEDCPPNCLETSEQHRWHTVLALQIPELGSATPGGLVLVLAGGRPRQWLASGRPWLLSFPHSSRGVQHWGALLAFGFQS